MQPGRWGKVGTSGIRPIAIRGALHMGVSFSVVEHILGPVRKTPLENEDAPKDLHTGWRLPLVPATVLESTSGAAQSLDGVINPDLEPDK